MFNPLFLSYFPRNWFSFKWFSPFVLMDFEWANPIFIYLIFLIPILFLLRRVIRLRYNEKVEVALSAENMRSQPIRWLRFLPDIFLGISLILFLFVAARPQKADEEIEQTSEGIDILLLMDISESMLIEDFEPNRLEAAKEVGKKFIEGRSFDRIGLIVFSGEAYSLAPLTIDYDLLKNYIDEIDQKMISKGKTAIGSAIAVAINRLKESETKSKVMILLSDGDNTAGNIDPITAAELAHAYKVKIYTIMVGAENTIGVSNSDTLQISETVDETTLKDIAKIGEGKYFRAIDNQALSKIFQQIDQFEKTEIKERRFTITHDYYYIYLIWAMIFWLIWLFLKSTFITNILED